MTEEKSLSEKSNNSFKDINGEIICVAKEPFFNKSDVRETILRILKRIDTPDHMINCSFAHIKRIIEEEVGEELVK